MFLDAQVFLGIPRANQIEKPQYGLSATLLMDVTYWVATDRYDLNAEQVALAYKFRWDIENFLSGGSGSSMSIICLPGAKTGSWFMILPGLII